MGQTDGADVELDGLHKTASSGESGNVMRTRGAYAKVCFQSTVKTTS